MINFAVPATAVPLSATASAIMATISAGVKRLPLNIFRVLSVTRYPAAGCRGFDEKKVRVTAGRSLDPTVLIPSVGAKADNGALGRPRPGSVGCDVPGCSDGFESGVDAESPKEAANVVPDRLGAEMELGSDLLRRAALLQQTKHLDLTRGEMRLWHDRRLGGASLDLSEDADDPFAVLERHRAELDSHPCAGGRYQEAGRLSRRRGTEHLAGERFAGAAAVLRRDN